MADATPIVNPDTPGQRPSGPVARPDIEIDALVRTLPAADGDRVMRLLRERDTLFLLHEAVLEAERAPSLDARLRVFVDAIRKIGFGRAAITLRDEDLNPTLIVTSGLSEEEDAALRRAPASGAVWRRRMAELERFRISQSYYLSGRDEWVRREFGAGVPSAQPPASGDDPQWSPLDSLLVPLRGRDGDVLGTLSLDDPVERRRPSMGRVRAVELFGQQMAYAIEQATLVSVSERRAARLQRLQEVGTMLSRSLDEREIVRELVRQIGRTLPTDGVVIARPDLEAGTIDTLLRVVRGVERPRERSALERGPIGEVARTGSPVRVIDYDTEHSALAASDDVVGDAGPAGSVLAVPMMVGIQLAGVIALHAEGRGAFSEEDEEVLLTIGGQAATALFNARLYAESQRERRQSEALADVARAVGESLRLGEVLQLILRHSLALLRGEGALVLLRQDDYMEVKAAVGAVSLGSGMMIPAANSAVVRATMSGTYAISNDVPDDPDVYRPLQRIASITKAVAAPLISAHGPIGLLSVINRAADFTEEDARVLQRLADQVAVAIVNARLFGEVAEATREWTVAFDAIASGMVVLDADARITRCNGRAVQIAGVADERELIGREFHEALLDERPPFQQPSPVVTALTAATIGRGTMYAQRRGQLLAVVAAPHPVSGAVVTFDDVTSHHTLAERHRRVVETASDAIVITDLQRRVSFANPAAYDLFAGRAEIVGMPVSDLVPADQQAEVAQREAAALTGQPQRYETVIVRGDGEQRIVSVSTAPLKEVGQVTGIVASLRDVTEERRARDAVANSESRYRNLFETASDAIYTLDAKGAFTSVNEATCRLVACAREELVGRSIIPYLDPDEVSPVTEQFRRTVEGLASHYECHIIRQGGDRRLVSVTNTPIRVGREVVGVLGIARDVTAERERAAALERSESRYARLVESASDAIFTVDEEGAFTSVNRALEETVGRPRDDLLGSHFTTVIDPRDHAAMWQVFVRTLQGGRERGELRYVAADGRLGTGTIVTAPIMEGGRVTGGLGVVRDTTEEKRLLDQMMQQEKLAAIGQLVSGVAHELNNPLAAVSAFAQLLRDSGTLSDEERLVAAVTIHDESRRAARIVSNLLTFARQHAPQRSPTDINAVVRDTLELRRYALTMSHIQLDVALAEPLPKTAADPFQLQQVVLNLLTNAERALADRPAGDGAVRRISLRTAHRDGQITIAVGDTGVGIEPANIDRLFDPFFTTRPVGQGAGLGLSIAHGIVHEHGGTIRVESTPGAGATFTVSLPVVAVAPAPAPAAPARPAPRPVRTDGGRLSILVVDDEPAIREALRRFLMSAGHTVETVANGAEALDRLRDRRFDAILLDLRMPVLSGDAVFEQLRAVDPEHADRVVFITGDVQSASARDFLHASGRPWIHKPFSFEDVADVLFAGAASPPPHPPWPVS